MVPLQKIKRKIQKINVGRNQGFNLAIAFACIFVGYIIAKTSDSTQEAFQEIKELKSMVSEMEGVNNINDLKEKVKNDPSLLEKMNPSTIEKYKSNPLFKKRIEEKLKELK